jgi:hypothetical protein
MSKFNLFAEESSVAERPSFQEAAVAAERMSAKHFAAGLGLWFLVMFAIGCLILTA